MRTAWRWSRRAGAAWGEHELARDATLRLRAGRQVVVLRVGAGCVLVTREGDLEDHVLGPGDELRLAGRGLSVAWALSPARVAVVPGTRAPAPTAPRAALAGV